MEKMKTWVNVITAGFAIGFLDGFFALGLPDGLYLITGSVMVLAIVRLQMLVNNK